MCEARSDQLSVETALTVAGRILLSRAISLVITAAVMGLTLLPSDAQLRFRANAAHGDLWRHVYSQLPSIWKARQLVYVREVSDDDMDRFVEKFEGPNDENNSIVDGCYQGNVDSGGMAGQITLRQSLHGENAALVFAHEYGHYVWADVLSTSDRARYRRIWREQRRANSLVTEYAEAGDEEGFAEAFAYFLRRPDYLHRMDLISWRYLSGLEKSAAVEPH